MTLQTGWCWKLKNWSPCDCGGQAICHDAVQLGTSCQAASLSPKKELASGIECSHAGVSYFCRIISGENKRKRWWFRNGNLRIFRLARRQSKQGTREKLYMFFTFFRTLEPQAKCFLGVEGKDHRTFVLMRINLFKY